MSKNYKEQHQVEPSQADETASEHNKESQQEWKERFLRVSADLENFRRRIEKERVEWMQVAQAQLAKDMISIVDDFERALMQESEPKDEAMKNCLAGFRLIGQALEKTLKKYGLQEIEETFDFDPMLHEAVAQIESAEHESGQIVDVLQKGYRFKDKVLRPAKVSVAK